VIGTPDLPPRELSGYGTTSPNCVGVPPPERIEPQLGKTAMELVLGEETTARPFIARRIGRQTDEESACGLCEFGRRREINIAARRARAASAPSGALMSACPHGCCIGLIGRESKHPVILLPR
jgi:hypothetical protein